MRSLFYMLTAVSVIALAFWAYHENYRTQEAQAHAAELQREIADTRQRLRMLRAEWAYLNRPDRLRDLVEVNFDRMQLMPLDAYQFGKIDQVAYPRLETQELTITDPVDVSNNALSGMRLMPGQIKDVSR